ncbi:RNA repair transcriptional activator RtcR [Pelagicoccus mobilis]|uniref:Sigma 54-interacting transcriptional regulator n=1 Tax=Pelagicoccus mobilis TaxID=415221 RepID=A0A934S3B3_9BACT|nr:RNA repair transcriptional activator RtcR [Pelagicoccus mobilis]MBK1880319.1 sigma 54-interacting transcriptional regulator [Pelagicoccus mobilis]
MKKLVSIGILGVQLDSFEPHKRWDRWRPTVSLLQQEDLLIDRFELLYEPRFAKLAKTVSEDMTSVSPETEVNQHEVNMGDPWDLESVYGALYDFAANYPFDTDNEDYIVHITTGTHVCQICLFLLAESRRLPARLIQTSPPKRAGVGNPGDYRIIDLDLSRYDQLAARFEIEKQDVETQLKSGIATRNKSFNAMIREIEQVAIRSPHPILITGPTGAGKSQLARRIYEVKRSKRGVSGAFVEVNCATLRGDAAMSALFGHKKGSFTGALDDRGGLLKSANKGVLFLDEIGELGLDEQAMLLRAIEEKRFLPLGSDQETESDFTLISGTNRDLSEEVAKGNFREDLLARINLWSYQLPGLSDRKEDIEPNIAYELSRYAEDHGRQAIFNKEAKRAYESFATNPESKWTGNFRDLNASVTRMATLAGTRRINLEIVESEISRLQKSWKGTKQEQADDLILEEVLDAEASSIDPFDKPQLAQVIRTCRESRNLSEAGRKLFAISRLNKKTSNDSDRLRKYLAKFGLKWESVCS